MIHHPRHFPEIIRVAGEKHQHHHQQLQEIETHWAIIPIATCFCFILNPICFCFSPIIITLTCFCFPAIIITIACFCFSHTIHIHTSFCISSIIITIACVCFSQKPPSLFQSDTILTVPVSDTILISAPVSVSQPEVSIHPLPAFFSVVLATFWLSYHNLSKSDFHTRYI